MAALTGSSNAHEYWTNDQLVGNSLYTLRCVLSGSTAMGIQEHCR